MGRSYLDVMTPDELVAKVKNLPPISQAALQLVNLLDEPAVSNEDVVQVLKYDNVLTAKLLRACNSPYFGLEEPVSSVDQAVLILGHHQILHIVLTLAFGGAMAVPLAGYAVESNELWRHSLTAATASEFLVTRGIEMNVDPPVAFTIGLLHDIGKLVLTQVLTPEHQRDIRALITDRGLARYEAEKNVLGTDHGEVGGALKIALTAPPVDGRANQACIEFIAELLGLPRSAVTIISGEHGRNKVVRLAGISADAVRSKLES